ncbi:hypothetical protein FOA52_015210 [Chlamydomonas sp. UWO 241]|nr:hypothetical protein FOA52_015210 [Chlamydomonas sp. UWO 241]
MAASAHTEALSLAGEAVLGCELVFFELWGQLGRLDKQRLRLVCRCTRDLANVGVQYADLRCKSAGIKQAHDGRERTCADNLTAALARWPGLADLRVSCYNECHLVLRAAPLPRLRKLVLCYETLFDFGNNRWDIWDMYHNPNGRAVREHYWVGSMPALSPTAAAGLTELHLIDDSNLGEYLSIAALSSCTQLQRLSIVRTSMDDLHPLASCAQLRSLSFLGVSLGGGGYFGLGTYTALTPLTQLAQLRKLLIEDGIVPDLAPLAGCPRLSKLSLRNCSCITSVTQLLGVTQLQELNVMGCYNY